MVAAEEAAAGAAVKAAADAEIGADAEAARADQVVAPVADLVETADRRKISRGALHAPGDAAILAALPD